MRSSFVSEEILSIPWWGHLLLKLILVKTNGPNKSAPSIYRIESYKALS